MHLQGPKLFPAKRQIMEKNLSAANKSTRVTHHINQDLLETKKYLDVSVTYSLWF